MAKSSNTPQQKEQSSSWFSWFWGSSKPVKPEVLTVEEKTKVQQLIAQFEKQETPLTQEDLTKSIMAITNEVKSELTTGQKRALELKVEAGIVSNTKGEQGGWLAGIFSIFGFGTQQPQKVDPLAARKSALKGLEGALVQTFQTHVAENKHVVTTDWERNTEGKWVAVEKKVTQQPSSSVAIETPVVEDLTQSISHGTFTEKAKVIGTHLKKLQQESVPQVDLKPEVVTTKKLSDSPELTENKKALEGFFKQRLEQQRSNQSKEQSLVQ